VTAPQEHPYQLRITGPAARALAGRLPEKIATAVHEFITSTLLDAPRRLGKPLLLPPYEGTYSARRGSYRILYAIDEEQRLLIVTTVLTTPSQGRIELPSAAPGQSRPQQS
jgi:mRNA-degrading endonuclease RelE of RelBE toxin-antitoxin system